MFKNKIKYFFSITWIIFVGILTYLSRTQYFLSEFLFKYTILKDTDIIRIKEIILLVGFIIISVPASIQLYRLKESRTRTSSQHFKLLQSYKQLLINSLEDSVHLKNAGFMLRILVRKKKFSLFNRDDTGRIVLHPHHSVIFVSKSIPGFTDDEDCDQLSYEVSPVVQDIAGMCYQKKRISYDFNYADNIENYNLTKYQIVKSSSLNMRVGTPIYNNNSVDEIFAILLIDSEKQISLSEKNKQKLFKMILAISNSLEEKIDL